MYIYHHLAVWKHGDVIVIRFGDHRILDELTVNKISDELYGVADREDCHNLLLNFASVVGLSSLMLGKLLMLQKKMEAKGGKLKICEVGPAVEGVFEETKLNRIFDIRQSEQDALKTFG